MYDLAVVPGGRGRGRPAGRGHCGGRSRAGGLCCCRLLELYRHLVAGRRGCAGGNRHRRRGLFAQR